MHNNKTRELQIVTSVDLSDDELRLLISVAGALNGVRMDLSLQEVVDIVVEMYNVGHSFDEIGLSVLGAVKGQPELEKH